MGLFPDPVGPGVETPGYYRSPDGASGGIRNGSIFDFL